MYSQVCTLRPPTAELFTVTRASKCAPITPPQPRGQGVCPLATVESPAIHPVKRGRAAGLVLGEGGVGSAIAGGVIAGGIIAGGVIAGASGPEPVPPPSSGRVPSGGPSR